MTLKRQHFPQGDSIRLDRWEEIFMNTELGGLMMEMDYNLIFKQGSGELAVVVMESFQVK